MKFTVIIPIYNAEKYLDDCISSVLNQTLDFENNIALVLVNDGSTDLSENICIKYKSMYPNNIFYKKILNSGPATARNTGIQLIPYNTNYVTFLDADDMLDLNFFQETKLFYEEFPRVKVSVLPVYYFEKNNGPIKLNNRFKKGTRIINICKEYSSPQFYIGGVVFDSSIFLNKNIQFDENKSFWEDALFVNKVIISEGEYGAINSSTYWYRKRFSNDSLVDTSWNNKSRYSDLINFGYIYLLNYSYQLYNCYIPYAQYMIIYHLKLFVFQKNSEMVLKILSEKEKEEFIQSVIRLLKLIEDKYILEQDTKLIHKEFLMSLKKGKKINLTKTVNKINNKPTIKITKKKVYKTRFHIEGYLTSDEYTMKKEDRIFVQSFNKKIYAQPIFHDKKIKIWGITVRDYKNSGFFIDLPIWCFVFQFGILTKEGALYLNKVNILKTAALKIFKKMGLGHN